MAWQDAFQERTRVKEESGTQAPSSKNASVNIEKGNLSIKYLSDAGNIRQSSKGAT